MTEIRGSCHWVGVTLMSPSSLRVPVGDAGVGADLLLVQCLVTDFFFHAC